MKVREHSTEVVDVRHLDEGDEAQRAAVIALQHETLADDFSGGSIATSDLHVSASR